MRPRAYPIFEPSLRVPVHLELLDEPGAPHLGVVEVPVPLRQILHGGLDAAVAGLGPVGHLDAEAASGPGPIGRGSMGDHLRGVVEEAGAGHAQRSEDPLLGEVAEGLAAHALDHQGEEEVAGVAVAVLVARLEVQLLLPDDDGEAVGVVREVLVVEPGQGHEVGVVPHAAGVVQQVAEGHRRGVIRHLGDVLADRIVQGKLALLGQEQDARRGDLLRGGADVEHCLGRDGHPMLQARHPIALLIRDTAILDHREGAAGRIRLGVLGEDGVDFGGQILGLGSPGGDPRKDEKDGKYDGTESHETSFIPHFTPPSNSQACSGKYTPAPPVFAVTVNARAFRW